MFVGLFDVVSDIIVVYLCFCWVIFEYNDQFCIGDIIWVVVIIGIEYIIYCGIDLCGIVAVIVIEKIIVRVYQMVWDV